MNDEQQIGDEVVTLESPEVPEIEAEIEAAPEAEKEDAGKESSDHEGEDHEKVKFTPEQQELVNKIINKKFGKSKELEEKLTTVQAELEKYKPKDERPAIPDIPQISDSKFTEKMTERDRAIESAAKWDQKEASRSEQRLQQQKQTQENQLKAFKEVVTAYTTRAKNLNISEEDLKPVGERLQPFNFQPQLTAHLLEHDVGPAISLYLSNNPIEAEKVASMSITKAAVYIESQVREKALNALKIEDDDVPPPPRRHKNESAGGEDLMGGKIW